jgi:hypothetical protein
MPDAKNNAKQTGDTHPPEVEEKMGTPENMPEGVGADGTPRDRGQGRAQGRDLERDLENESRPGKGENQAGFLKDKDAPGSDNA